jgi:hypothetical protein
MILAQQGEKTAEEFVKISHAIILGTRLDNPFYRLYYKLNFIECNEVPAIWWGNRQAGSNAHTVTPL